MSKDRRFAAFPAMALVAALCLAILASGCGQSYTRSPGVLSVASPTDVIPFEMLKGGKLTGFDVELGKAIAARLGLKYKFVATPWNNLLPDLKSGKYDMVMAAMTITYDRSKTVDFSDPYFNTDQSIAVPRGSPIKSGTDLAGKVVGVLNASTPQYAAEQIKVLKGIQRYDTVDEVYAALASGKVDAMIMDLSIAQYRSNLDHKTVVVAEIKTDENYGIATRQGNAALEQKLNGALKQLKSDGTYKKIYSSWFGSAPVE
jgi:polar amino acid transport system substrate-binding protein